MGCNALVAKKPPKSAIERLVWTSVMVQPDCKPSFFLKQMLLIVVLIEDFKKESQSWRQFFFHQNWEKGKWQHRLTKPLLLCVFFQCHAGCHACFVVFTGFAGAFNMPWMRKGCMFSCAHLQAWQGRHHSSACFLSVRETACAVDLWTWNFSILSLWPLVHYLFFFVFGDFRDETWHLLQFGVGIHSACHWERTHFAFGCEDNYECVCRMSEFSSMWTGSFSMLSQHCHWSWCHTYFPPSWTWAFSGGSADSLTQVPGYLSQVFLWLGEWKNEKKPTQVPMHVGHYGSSTSAIWVCGSFFQCLPRAVWWSGGVGGEWNRISCHEFQRHENQILR